VTYRKQAVVLALWLQVCTYGTRVVFWHDKPMEWGPFVIAGFIGAVYLLIGWRLDDRRSRRDAWKVEAQR
jgi:hypothetical protein